jgi:hypothetical protein
MMTVSQSKPPDIPDFLKPGDGFEADKLYPGLRCLELAKLCSAEFGIPLSISIPAILTVAAHALGECVQLDLGYTRLSAPFNLMVVTPESKPLWIDALLRPFGLDLEQNMTRRLVEQSEGQKKPTESRKETGRDSTETQVEMLAAQIGILHRTVDRITCSGLRTPFIPPAIDRVVTLTTPKAGLHRTMATLTSEERRELQSALWERGSQTGSFNAPDRPARPSFFWQLPASTAPVFFRKNLWLKRFPFLLLECPGSDIPELAQTRFVKQFAPLCDRLFLKRFTTTGKPELAGPDARALKPITDFLREAQAWEAAADRPFEVRWIAELGARLALIMMEIDADQSLSKATYIMYGLELAKNLARTHLINLSARLPLEVPDDADNADMTDLERSLYLRICKKGRADGVELRRSFHQLTAENRDRALAKLTQHGLIECIDGQWQRKAA